MFEAVPRTSPVHPIASGSVAGRDGSWMIAALARIPDGELRWARDKSGLVANVDGIRVGRVSPMASTPGAACAVGVPGYRWDSGAGGDDAPCLHVRRFAGVVQAKEEVERLFVEARGLAGMAQGAVAPREGGDATSRH